MALRTVIGAGLLLLVVATFSLRPPEPPRSVPLGPEAYRPADAVGELATLARRHPVRTAGSPGDRALARDVAASLGRAARGMEVQQRPVRAATPDGRRTLVEVQGTLPGPPGPELVVVAHRDAVVPGARADLSGTAVMLELARAIGRGRVERTVRFVSISGASGGGLAGATELARALEPEDVRAALVLGDVASPGVGGGVVPWSNDAGGTAPPDLVRTAVLALRREGLAAREPRLAGQLVRQALPATTGAQGELLQGGVPAVLLGSPRPADAGARPSPALMTAYGRAALRTVQAVDPGAAPLGAIRTRVSVLGRELPLWVVRLALLMGLVPVAIGVVAGARALATRPTRLAVGLAWPLAAALPVMLTGSVAIVLARLGLLSSATAAPYAGEALAPGLVGWSLLVALAVVAALATLVARPALLRAVAGRPRDARPDPAARAWGVGALLLALCAILLVRAPLAAALLLPAALAWPIAAADEPPLPVAARRALVAAGALPLLLGAVAVTWDLGVAPHELPWWLVLLVAGGHVPPLALLAGSVVLGALVAAAGPLWPRRAPRPPRARRAVVPPAGTPGAGDPPSGAGGGPAAPEPAGPARAGDPPASPRGPTVTPPRRSTGAERAAGGRAGARAERPRTPSARRRRAGTPDPRPEDPGG